jgi:DNA-binding CsgD family transcriptional regulator/tetratricopeptide (TPR) repeat protein
MLVGRGDEQARIEALLADAASGVSRALVIRGEPGIGKSALLRYAAERAEGLTVLRATGIESESELPFSGLSELLRPLIGRLNDIPPPQAAALAGALALGPPVAEDGFTIRLATLSLLAHAAEQRPVLALVDDAHWLDASSRDALLFTARRLQADRVLMLFAARSGEPIPFDAPGVAELELQGIDEDACSVLLARAAGSNVAATVVRKIRQATGGNPLAILETPRVLSAEQLAGVEPLAEPLPAGPGIKRSFERRVAALPAETQTALLLVAASPSASTTEVRRACGVLGIAGAALEDAETAGLIRDDGLRIQFDHPLVRAAVYHRVPPPARRAAHRALAQAIEKDASVGRKAWHLAAAALGEDEQVAAILEDAAREARERSGHAAAASAFERAAHMTTDREQRARRLLEAGRDAFVAGEPGRALAFLQEALQHTRDASLRADIEHTRGRIEMSTQSPTRARKTLLAAADAVEPQDPARAALILVDAVTTCFREGDPDEGVMRPALRIAKRGYELGSQVGGVAEAAAGGLLGKTLVLLGRAEEGYPLLLRWQEKIEEIDLSLGVQLIQCALVFMWLEEYERARTSLERFIDRARSAGALGVLSYPLCNLSEVDFRTGRWSAAYADASEAYQLATELGQTVQLIYALICLAWVEAGLGREQDCREHLDRALSLYPPFGLTAVGYCMSIRGLLELGLGRNMEATTQLQALSQQLEREGVGEPALGQFMPDLIEACARAGARAEAEGTLESFEALARKTGRTWALATAARCKGILAGSDFEEPFEEALRWHGATPTPFDMARTELCYGERLRRARRRAGARVHLRSALDTFEQLGAQPWAERARVELSATGETARSRRWSGEEQLTRQELQIANVVAQGATNREVAEKLFLSVKTVEAHLGRIYGKLGVRSRTELARRFAQEGW